MVDVIETFDAADRMRQRMGAQLIGKKLGRDVLEFQLLFHCGISAPALLECPSCFKFDCLLSFVANVRSINKSKHIFVFSFVKDSVLSAC